MASAKTCNICSNFITCHGTVYRYIICKTCHPSEVIVCIDCYHDKRHFPGSDHEFRLTIHDQNTDRQYTESLDRTHDLLAIEAGCSQSVDPLLDLAKPENMPKDWFRCIHILPAHNSFDLLECVLIDEEYPHNTKLEDMAVIHPPRSLSEEASHAILCNNELVEVPESLYHILNNILNATKTVNGTEQEEGMRKLAIERFWIAELCLAESIRSSPPIPLEAICALAGCLTDNHIFCEEIAPQPEMYGNSSVVKLLRLVKFDRFGTPVMHCREVQQDSNPVFHIRMSPKVQNATGATVFVNGRQRSVSPVLISFLRTCACETVSEYSVSRYEHETRSKKVAPDCPIHGDTEFFIPELCLDSADTTETSSEQSVWNWIKDNATTQKDLDGIPGNAYSPLDAGEIRLLRFFPFRLGRKGNIDVPMATITHRLDQAPKFAALSYCWGSSNRDCFLPMLTYDTLKITQHLGQIIRDLVKSGITNVWIDQICIDQENLEEKAVQVARMLQIYKAADEVLIHLGQLSAPDKVVRFVNDIVPRCRRQGLSFANFQGALSQDDLACWFAFRQARSSPWFSRTWIVQEMSVNPRTSVLLGLECVPWDDFLAADSWTDFQIFTSSIPRDIIGIHSMPVFAKIRRQLQQGGGYDAVNFFEILHFARFLEAREPKDKVFAFMGMFDQASVGKWLPFPNYRRHTVDVYTSFAASYALNGYTLPLLQLAGTSQTSEDHQSLPSWVPDWSFGSVLYRSLRRNREFEHGKDGFSSGLRFEGSAGLRTLPLQDIATAVPRHGTNVEQRRVTIGDFPDRHQPREREMKMMDDILLPMIDHINARSGDSRASIIVKAALFDEILDLTKLHVFEELLTTLTPSCALQMPKEALLELNSEAFGLVSAHIDASDAANRLAKTVIADTWKEKDSHDVAQIHRQWLQALQNAKDGMLSEMPDNSSPVWRYAGRVRQTFQNRVFGLTKGCRMGIFPSTTRPGDRVGIIAGLDLPYVFSEVGAEGFALVGEAYVEGVMYGEFQETEEAKFQELEIM